MTGLVLLRTQFPSRFSEKKTCKLLWGFRGPLTRVCLRVQRPMTTGRFRAWRLETSAWPSSPSHHHRSSPPVCANQCPDKPLFFPELLLFWFRSGRRSAVCWWVGASAHVGQRCKFDGWRLGKATTSSVHLASLLGRARRRRLTWPVPSSTAPQGAVQ